MQVLQKPIKAALDLLPPVSNAESKWALHPFCIKIAEDERMLLYHPQTQEVLLLEENEWPEDYLRTHFFLVPEGYDACAIADQIRAQLCFRNDTQHRGYHSYTILSTTDCNARCFYCYEQGCEHINMSLETADKVAAFIRDTADRKRTIQLRLFGGEPLMGKEALDRITDSLQREQLSFSSEITTNGFLFNQEIVEQAVSRWHLEKAQITLDGTEEVYNKRKAYVHSSGSAFRRVLDNIDSLLMAGIRVQIRLNMDEGNYEDLSNLVDQLAERWKGNENLSVYPHLLFQVILSSEERIRNRHYELLDRLRERIGKQGLLKPPSLPKHLTLNHCMTDEPGTVVILPDGRLFSCEHFTDVESFGHIDTKDSKKADLLYFREQFPRDEACAGCPLYPSCFRPAHCPSQPQFCIPQDREYKIGKLKEGIRRLYLEHSGQSQ